MILLSYRHFPTIAGVTTPSFERCTYNPRSLMARDTPRKILPLPVASKGVLFSLLAAGWCISSAESWGVSSTAFFSPVGRGNDVAVGTRGATARSSGPLPVGDKGERSCSLWWPSLARAFTAGVFSALR